ncbi:MAG: ABC transporter substrate-binding protein [Thermodesulfobacteriota bacterium]
MGNKPKFVVIIVLIFLAAVFAFSILKHKSVTKPSQYEKLTFGVVKAPVAAPICVGYQKGFFQKEGLNLTIQNIPSGPVGLDSLMAGGIQLLSVAETVVMYAGLEGKGIYIIATIADSDELNKIVALKGRGILGFEGLRGKRIGYTPGTTGDFFLGSSLTFHAIKKTEILPVPLTPDEMLPAMMKRDVDAVVTWYPVVSLLEKKLGTDAVVFGDDLYRMTLNVICRQDYVRDNPETIRKVLRGLIQAKQYIGSHTDEAIAITAEYIGEQPERLKKIWPAYFFDVKISETLLVNLEDQARWAIKNNPSGHFKMLDYSKLIYTKGLESIDPMTVTLRHAD